MNEHRLGWGPGRQAKSLLIVDDTVANLLAFSSVLKKMGCRIVTASSGPEAIRCTELEDFSVILMDVRMPEWNGFETAHQLRNRERTRHTPIFFMSAFEVPPLQVLAEFVGAEVDFIPSPVDTDLLIRKVAPYLKNSAPEEPKDPSEANLQKASLGEMPAEWGGSSPPSSDSNPENR